MSELSDEQLMSYADGELSSTDRAKVEAYLTNDPAARARLAVFAQTGKSLADIYQQPMLEPVPQHLIDAITGQANTSSAVVIPFRRTQTVPRAMPQWAIAASAALAMCAVGFYALRGPSGPSSGNGAEVASNELASALETVASGTSVPATIGNAPASIKPVFTFATAERSYCRQYQLNRSKADSVAGVACRLQDGRWHIEGQFVFSAPAGEPGQIAPAGAESSAATDALVDKLIAGDVLDPADEASIMHRSWTPPSQ